MSIRGHCKTFSYLIWIDITPFSVSHDKGLCILSKFSIVHCTIYSSYYILNDFPHTVFVDFYFKKQFRQTHSSQLLQHP